MQSLNPQVLRKEIGMLPVDLVQLLPDLLAQVKGHRFENVDRVFLVGSGDSYFSGLCATMACQDLTGLPCRAIPSFEFVNYTKNICHANCLVVVSSASGNTPGASQALTFAREQGAQTVAVTTNSSGSICELAELTLVAELPNKEPCPGVRSFQALLLGILAIVLEILTNKGRSANHYIQDINGIAKEIDDTTLNLFPIMDSIAEALENTPIWVVAGSGPNHGTAQYAAAKFTESLGRFAIGTDIDEWYHIERQVISNDLPVFLIAPPGFSKIRALQIAEIATDAGWRVYTITDKDDKEFEQYSERVLPVQGKSNEIFSPLLYQLFAPMLAGLIAERTSTKLFPARSVENKSTSTYSKR